jgi:DNA segregation ATPase FtsK/SpoIIIE, S-DNA-T family
MAFSVPRESRRQEVIGVLLLALGLLLLISQLSYDPLDPSFTTLGSGTVVHNLAGRAGAYLTDALFQLLGTSAYLITLFFLLTGWRSLFERSVPIYGGLWRIGGILLLLFSFSAFSSLWFWALPTMHAGPTLIGKAGGLAGYFITSLMLNYFAAWGTYILVTACLVASVMMTTSLSPIEVWNKTESLLFSLKERISTAMLIYREKSRRWKHQPRFASRLDRPRPKISETPPPAPARPKQEVFEFAQSAGGRPVEPGGKGRYQLPPLSLLNDSPISTKKASKDELVANSQLLEKKLLDYGIEGKVTQVHPGPVVTLYEFEPAAGVKVNRIVNLSDDLALAMRAMSVRIVAPIPGKSAVGVEIPNHIREDVSLKEILSSKAFAEAGTKLTLALGKDIFGQPVVADLAAMPHLLVAGATGSGKSVALNTMILSILFARRPQEVKFLMIDPKMLELLAYDGIPHLLCPVITRPKVAAEILHQMVVEMQQRYRLLAEAGVRNIEGYNKNLALRKLEATSQAEPASANEAEPLPYLVIVIDELADLMVVVSREVEDSIARLAQMARAAGIHLIVATQRPSVDVLTGIIKANFSARISFQVSSKIDSRTILDANGAEQLLGRGDLLYLASGTGRITRIHGSYVSEGEIKKVVDFIKTQGSPSYQPHLLAQTTGGGPGAQSGSSEERDELYEKAIQLVLSTGQASASFIQRRLRVGYPRAARMIEIMEEDGILGPSLGGRPREIRLKRSPFQESPPP